MPTTEPSTSPTPPSASPTHTPAAQAWAGESLDAVHTREDKAPRVRAMFGAIARSYDLNNRLHSFGRDQAWRRAAVKAAAVPRGGRVLDVACGTGDLTEALARTNAREVIGLDFTREMLDVAGVKRDRLPPELGAKVSYVEGDAMDLPFESAAFDALTIAFGIRNVQDPHRALREFARVLKPGGRLVVLEFDRPRLAPVRWGNDFYCKVIMPRTAALISRDRSGAYAYLPKSVDQFMDRAQLGKAILDAGFVGLTQRPLTLGVCVCHSAARVANPAPGSAPAPTR
ncbi:MAG: bifunctional demethylmenaquinone methyltransferase/2-methoxy-6-polyprenyl-1,4-benzoquinol methylase UbiE [Phycisphaerales bacterium JB059]